MFYDSNMDLHTTDIAPKEPKTSTPSLSTASLAALVVAGMIGSGIYTTTGFALADLHSPELVLIAWCVAGVIAICGAISYGELASRLLESGGEYLYLTRFVHPLAGFLAGWVSALAGFTGAAALAAVLFETYAIPDSVRPDWLPTGLTSACLVLILTSFHAIGIRTGTVSQNVVVMVKLCSLAVFMAWAFILWPDWFVNQPPVEEISGTAESNEVSWLVFATSTMWISFSFTGFNSPIYVAEESRTGIRGVRRSMVVGTLLVTAIYLILNSIFLYSAEPDLIKGEPGIALVCAQQLGSVTMQNLLRMMISLGLASSVSSMLMMGPRVYRKMADDGVFPSSLVPSGDHFRVAIIIQGLAIILVTIIAGLQDLLSYLSMTLSLCSAGTVATLLLCRRDRNGREFRRPSAAVWLAATLYCCASIAIAGLSYYGNPKQGTGTLVTVLVGVIVFQFLKQPKSRGPGIAH